MVSWLRRFRVSKKLYIYSTRQGKMSTSMLIKAASIKGTTTSRPMERPRRM